jgi:hypothetical protein
LFCVLIFFILSLCLSILNGFRGCMLEWFMLLVLKTSVALKAAVGSNLTIPLVLFCARFLYFICYFIYVPNPGIYAAIWRNLCWFFW